MILKKTISPDAIFFDWDNTLIDNWTAIHLAYNKTLKQMGFKEQSFNKTLKESKYSLRDAFPKTFKSNWKKAKTIFYKEFKNIHLKNLKPKQGSELLLSIIKKKKILVGIISNKDGKLLRKEVGYLKWTNKYFKIIIGANDALKDKPSDYPFKLALSKIGKKPSKKIWYVGDSDIDIQFAKKCGCYSIFLETKNLKREKLSIKPDLVIKKISFLKKYLK